MRFGRECGFQTFQTYGAMRRVALEQFHHLFCSMSIVFKSVRKQEGRIVVKYVCDLYVTVWVYARACVGR